MVRTGKFRVTALLGMFAILALWVGGVAPASADAADVYSSSYRKVGTVNYSYSGRYSVKQSYSTIGDVRPSYSGRWDIYRSYSKLGYVRPSYSGRWDIYRGYSKVGELRPGLGTRWDVYRAYSYSRIGWINGGPSGPAAGAALLLLL
jgi:hypothetical protein